MRVAFLKLGTESTASNYSKWGNPDETIGDCLPGRSIRFKATKRGKWSHAEIVEMLRPPVATQKRRPVNVPVPLVHVTEIKGV